MPRRRCLLLYVLPLLILLSLTSARHSDDNYNDGDNAGSYEINTIKAAKILPLKSSKSDLELNPDIESGIDLESVTEPPPPSDFDTDSDSDPSIPLLLHNLHTACATSPSLSVSCTACAFSEDTFYKMYLGTWTMVCAEPDGKREKECRDCQPREGYKELVDDEGGVDAGCLKKLFVKWSKDGGGKGGDDGRLCRMGGGEYEENEGGEEDEEEEDDKDDGNDGKEETKKGEPEKDENDGKGQQEKEQEKGETEQSVVPEELVEEPQMVTKGIWFPGEVPSGDALDSGARRLIGASTGLVGWALAVVLLS